MNVRYCSGLSWIGEPPWEAGLWEKEEEVYGWVWVQEKHQCSFFHGGFEDLVGHSSKGMP